MDVEKLVGEVSNALKPFFSSADIAHDEHIEVARAAIIATLKGVREPSGGMEAAGGGICTYEPNEDGDRTLPITNPVAGEVWEAMLDHLIKTVEGE